MYISYIQVELNIKDLRVVYALLIPAAARWLGIATVLNPQLPDGTIAAIQLNIQGSPNAPQDGMREMLSTWLKLVRPCKPSWQRLKQAITDSYIPEAQKLSGKIDNEISKARRK